MNEITIRVAEKLPTLTGDVTRIVTDNTDYTLAAEYDGDWQDGLKTYFAVLSDGTVLEPIVGENAITLPRLPAGSSGWLYVGVQQGNMVTSRPCAIPVLPSIMAELPDPPVPPPEPDVYAQIIGLINQMPAALHAAENAAASASSAQTFAQSAEAAAQIAQDAVGQMAFVTFEIDSDGNLIINHAERLGSTSFRLTDAGNLEVELNGSN